MNEYFVAVFLISKVINKVFIISISNTLNFGLDIYLTIEVMQNYLTNCSVQKGKLFNPLLHTCSFLYINNRQLLKTFREKEKCW